METIKERDYIDVFLNSIGVFDNNKNYTLSELDKILGEDANPFVDTVEYADIYNYIASIKQHKNVIQNVKQTDTTLEHNMVFDYTFANFLCFDIFVFVISTLFSTGTVYYRCATGFGVNLRVWSILSILLMCRTILYGKLPEHVNYHSIIGLIIFMNVIGHSVLHFIDNSESSHNEYDLTHISGYVLFGIGIILCTISIFRIRFPRKFRDVHFLSYLWLPLLIVHVQRLWIWFAIPLIIFYGELLFNIVFKTQISRLTTSNVSKQGKITFLSTPRKNYSVSGSYYRIMVPSISYEWHSYSIVNSELVDQLLFLINVKDEWSNELYKRVSAKMNDYVIIQGPFLTSFSEILSTDREQRLCIADGKLGISPFLSIMDTKTQISRCNLEYRENYSLMFGYKMQQRQAISLFDIIDNHTTNTPIRYNLKLVWIFSDPMSVEHLFDYIKYLLMESTKVDLDIYITDHFKGNSKTKQIFRVLHLLDGTNTCINIFFEKPNFINIFNSEKPDSVYCCGSLKLSKDIRTICNDNQIKYHYEKSL